MESIDAVINIDVHRLSWYKYWVVLLTNLVINCIRNGRFIYTEPKTFLLALLQRVYDHQSILVTTNY